MTSEQIEHEEAFGQLLGPERSSVPSGFAFRVMDKIFQEKIRRAESAASRQSVLVTLGLLLLAAAALFTMNFLGLGNLTWITGLPTEATWLACGILALLQLDQVFAARVNH